MVSQRFQNILAAAGACASKFGHGEVTVTHVTYILCTTGALNSAFQKLGKSPFAYQETVSRTLAGSAHFKTGGDSIRPSAALSECISRAESAARQNGRPEFSDEDFLVEALEVEHGNPADDAARKVFYALAEKQLPEIGATASSHLQSSAGAPMAAGEAAPQASGAEALALWTNDLVAAASRGEVDEVFGRDDEIVRTCQILRRRTKNNPLLVGEPGVGKTAVAEGLALMIARGVAPHGMSGKRIYALDMGRMVAGTRNRGDLEERIKSVIDAAAVDRNVILFIDEIHTLLVPNGAMTGLPDILKPALASGRLRCIGATTFDEFGKYFTSDPAMVRRFQQVPLNEPGREQAIAIITKASAVYAEHHGVSYDSEALIAAVDLSIRYLVGRQLPDKAIDILDEAATSLPEGQDVVTTDLIVSVVRRMSGDRFIGNDDETMWSELSQEAGSKIAGHADAVRGISDFLRGVSSHPVARTGAKASFLLEGPDGSGKRHIAETFAKTLGLPILVLDMASYGERNSVAALIGAPPGYVGYDDGGKLTEFARRYPSAVILFDKIDRASEQVRDLAATMISQGQLIDAKGRKISFRNVVVMVTRDVAAESKSFGFHSSAEKGRSAGVPGMQFDRAFATTLASEDAADAMVMNLLSTAVRSYEAAGTQIDVSQDVREAIVSRGRKNGGRGGDYVAAYTEMFESELFRSVVPKRGSLNVRMEDGRVLVETEFADAVAA